VVSPARDRLRAHDRYSTTRHFASLDGLRCLSIVPVIWHHATPRPLPGIWGKGPAGVDLFFCISGFLITTLLLRERDRTGSIALGDFYARRALRILPLYYTLLLGYVGFAAFLPSNTPQRAHFFHTLPWYVSFTAHWFADFGVAFPILFSFAWSLCIEEQFYVFWPWLVRSSTPRQALAAMGALLAIDWLAERGALSALLGPGGQALRIVTSFAAPIGLGSVLALLLHERLGFAVLNRVLGRAWSAPLALAAVFALLLWPSAPLFAFQGSLAALVGACVIRERNGLAALLQARPVAYVGAVSYGLYLLNSTAIGVIKRAFPRHASNSSFVFWLALPLALALASLSHRYLEAPFLRRRAHFRRAQLSADLETRAHSSSAPSP
jgi:peptidoglycan/LPS O-acetylase OafA/YrhL